MAKNKTTRSIDRAGQSQRVIEETSKDKFAQAEQKATKNTNDQIRQKPGSGRISPQLSCTISPEDKDMLNAITLYLIQKGGRPLTTSTIIRALIQCGNQHRDELDV